MKMCDCILSEMFHMQKVAQIVDVASKFESEIFIKYKDKKIDAKSPLGILSIPARKGNDVIVSADGIDEEEAVRTLIRYI